MNGEKESSVIIVDEEQVGKLKFVRIVAQAKDDRLHRLTATQLLPFQGNSGVKVIIPNQPKRGQGCDQCTPVD